MFKLSTPTLSKKGDIVFHKSGIRFSNDFIERENLEGANYLWIFLDEPHIAFQFFKEHKSNAIKLTNSSSNTAGKTASCAYLKKYDWIKRIMLTDSVNERKFTVLKADDETEFGTRVKHKINLRENASIYPRLIDPTLDDEFDIPF